METKILKRVVIKEEFMALTNDVVEAIILSQMLYWYERMHYFDKVIDEESKKFQTEGKELNMEKTEGWIYKSAEELAEEIMVSGRSTVTKRLLSLVEKGYLEKRNNPKHSWDRELQYRVNIPKVVKDLFALGYTLEGYKISLEALKKLIVLTEQCIVPIEQSIATPEQSIAIVEQSIVPTEQTITENTTNNTSESTAERNNLPSSLNELLVFYGEMLEKEVNDTTKEMIGKYLKQVDIIHMALAIIYIVRMDQGRYLGNVQMMANRFADEKINTLEKLEEVLRAEKKPME